MKPTPMIVAMATKITIGRYWRRNAFIGYVHAAREGGGFGAF
jgi:hypothetical protein